MLVNELWVISDHTGYRAAHRTLNELTRFEISIAETKSLRPKDQ